MKGEPGVVTVRIDVIGLLLAGAVLFAMIGLGWFIALVLVSLGLATEAVPVFLGFSVAIILWVIVEWCRNAS
jgi:hypothetical protein